MSAYKCPDCVDAIPKLDGLCNDCAEIFILKLGAN